MYDFSFSRLEFFRRREAVGVIIEVSGRDGVCEVYKRVFIFYNVLVKGIRWCK